MKLRRLSSKEFSKIIVHWRRRCKSSVYISITIVAHYADDQTKIQKTFASEYFQFPLVTLFDIHWNIQLITLCKCFACWVFQATYTLLWSLTSVVIFQVYFEITPSRKLFL